jgi:hypothetical protein
MKTLDRLKAQHPDKIRDWYADQDGYWINLKPGWQWQDCHTVHEWIVKDVIESFKWIERCSCDECKAKVTS